MREGLEDERKRTQTDVCLVVEDYLVHQKDGEDSREEVEGANNGSSSITSHTNLAKYGG